MSHIFISYSRKDLDFAQKIVDALAANELDTWIDWKSIPKGEDWEQEIYRGIEGADAFLFLVSPDSVVSEMCNKEIAHAVANGKRILPIVIRDANVENFLIENVKEEISKRNWIFCRDGQDDFEKAIAEIRETINTDYEWLKYHTKFQVKALDWERREDKDDTSKLLRGKELQEAEQKFAGAGSSKDPQPTDIQRIYIETSRRSENEEQKRLAEERKKTRTRLRNLLVILSGIVILAIWLASQVGPALIREQKANETAQAAKTLAAVNETLAAEQKYIADADKLAEKALSEKDNQFDIALLLGIEANRAHDDSSTLGALLTLTNSQPRSKMILSAHQSHVSSVAFEPVYNRLATGSDDSTIILWDINDPEAPSELTTLSEHKLS